MEYSPEVLIFLQKFKLYLENNENVKKYFIGDTDSEEFYTYLLNVAQRNFEKNGYPELSIEQFEFLRKINEVFKNINDEDEFLFEYKTNKIKFHIK
jgi:hypothetical protein